MAVFCGFCRQGVSRPVNGYATCGRRLVSHMSTAACAPSDPCLARRLSTIMFCQDTGAIPASTGVSFCPGIGCHAHVIATHQAARPGASSRRRRRSTVASTRTLHPPPNPSARLALRATARLGVSQHAIESWRARPAYANVGITHETAEFAVESLRRYWRLLGRRVSPGSTAVDLRRRS